MFRNRVIKNFSANFFSQIITIFYQIIAIPIFIYYWGASKYGEWLILTTVLAYLAMSDIGFTTIASNDLAMQAGKDNKNDSIAIFQSTWILISFISIILLLITPLFWILPFEDYLNVHSINHKEVALVLFLLVLTVVASLQLGLINAGFNADGNNHFSVWMGNISKIFEIALVIVGLNFGANQVFIAALILISRLLSFLLSYCKLRKTSPWIVLGISYVKLSIFKKMLPKSIFFMAFPIGNAIKNQGLLTVVSILLGPIAVVGFSAVRTLSNTIYQCRGVIMNSIQSEISRYYGVNNLFQVKNIHRNASQVGLWVSIFCVLFLLIFGQKFINLWTLGKVSIDNNFFYLMLLAVFLNSVWVGSSVISIAINKIKRISIYYLISSIASILLSYFFVIFFGLIGVPVSLIFVDFIMIIFVIKFTLILLNDNFKEFTIAIVNPPFYLFKKIKGKN